MICLLMIPSLLISNQDQPFSVRIRDELEECLKELVEREREKVVVVGNGRD